MTMVYKFRGQIPQNFGQAEKSKIRRNYKKLSILAKNISGTIINLDKR